MPEPSLPARTDERRPTPLLLVYSWDLFLAILAVFGALAALGGGEEFRGAPRANPLALQIMGALSSASYAVVLAAVASLLTRRQRWIQRLQVIVLALAIGLAVISLVVGLVRGGGFSIGPLLVVILFLLIDAAAILAMTERRIAGWYTESGRVPRWAAGAVVFWVVTAVVLLVIDAVV